MKCYVTGSHISFRFAIARIWFRDVCSITVTGLPIQNSSSAEKNHMGLCISDAVAPVTQAAHI